MIKSFKVVALAGVLASVIHAVSANSTAGHHHKELAIVWPLFGSAILLSMMFSLCQTPGTAPYMWQVVNSVMCGILAMQWVDIFGQYIEPDDGNPVGRLIAWIVTYLVVCGFLYMLAASDTKFQAPPADALAWFVATAAGGFCTAVLPDKYAGHGVGVAILFAEQLAFYAIWLIPRTIEMGVAGWDVSDIRLGVPGMKGLSRQALRSKLDGDIAKWRSDCDGITWGAAPFALASNGLRMLKTALSGDKYCAISARCSWGSEFGGSMWINIAAGLVLVTAISVRPLLSLKVGTGVKNIVGSVLISALTTSVALSFLNVLRHEVSSKLCTQFGLCDDNHEVFFALFVAYASTFTAMLSAVVMWKLDEIMEGDGTYSKIFHYIQGAMGSQAGFAWYGVFSAASNTGAMEVVHLKGVTLAWALTATLLPLYVYFIRPAYLRAQDGAAAPKPVAAQPAKAVPATSPPVPQQPAARAPAGRPRASSPPARQQDLHQD